MKAKQIMLGMLAVAALAITSCGDDDDTTDNGNGGTTENFITGQITENKTLTNDVVWELRGRTTVTNGAVLTIEPGTIIKGFPGQGANASVLIIARGAQINANGTEDAPIIFTSTADNIQLGQTRGTNLTENDRGLWGGLIVLGNAPSSFRGDVAEVQIEGIPASDSNGLYGGTNATDNSGTLNYISIRYGGTNIGEGNEINGLTLGGVGSGTTVSNIEVVGNVDDGIEFFGGTVNASNLLVWAQGDDAIDIDQAYSGTIDNAAVVLGDNSDHALEIDGPEGSMDGAFTLNNVTLIGNMNTSKGEYADFRSNAQGAVNNVFATGFKDSSDVELDNNGVAQNFLDGELSFTNWVFELPMGVTDVADVWAEKVGCAANCDDADESNDIPEDKIILDGSGNPDFSARAAANWASTGTTGGANTSVFQWSYANQLTGVFN
jgi:hypothetical protein